MTFDRRGARAVIPAAWLLLLANTEAFLLSSSRPVRISPTPRKLPWPRPVSTPPGGGTSALCRRIIGMSTPAAETPTTAVDPEEALDPIISELRARILDAPCPLEGNEESRLHAEATLSTTFEVGVDGGVVGGFEQEVRLARALALDTFVVSRKENLWHCCGHHQPSSTPC